MLTKCRVRVQFETKFGTEPKAFTFETSDHDTKSKANLLFVRTIILISQCKRLIQSIKNTLE